MVFCPECKNEYSDEYLDDGIYCPECGISLKCPECGRELDAYAETCPYCFAVVVDDGEYAGYDKDVLIEQMDYERDSSQIYWD